MQLAWRYLFIYLDTVKHDMIWQTNQIKCYPVESHLIIYVSPVRFENIFKSYICLHGKRPSNVNEHCNENIIMSSYAYIHGENQLDDKHILY